MGRVQGDGEGDVPRPKVERLHLAQGLTQHLSSQGWPLVIEGKK